jgi:N utilization substance protein A
VLVPPDQLSLAIGREGQNVRLAARLTGWKIDIKNAVEYDQQSEDETVAVLIAQRREEEALQAEAEARLAAEQAARAEEDARLRELYPLPEDEEEQDEAYGEEAPVAADEPTPVDGAATAEEEPAEEEPEAVAAGEEAAR